MKQPVYKALLTANRQAKDSTKTLKEGSLSCKITATATLTIIPIIPTKPY